MVEQSNNGQSALPGIELLKALTSVGNFEIIPCESNVDFEDSNRFTKLALGSEQKAQISMFIHDIPAVIASSAMSQAYIAKFPEGLPHTLTALKQGGYGSMIRADGKFVGSASFYPMSSQAAILRAFTAMSVASGQYFLAQINSEMHMMRMKLDEILGFLYGDKKAELISEMSFIRYAYQNYSSIMTHDHQRIATIGSLQSAKKVAIQDIEFYISDLESTVSHKDKDYAGLRSTIDKSFQLKGSLDLAQQLYVMSSMMEVYFAQNQEAEYLRATEQDILSYIDKCDKRVLGNFSILKGRISNYRAKPLEKANKSSLESDENRIDSVIDALHDGEENTMRKAVRTLLSAVDSQAEYYLSSEGNIYIKGKI